MSVSVAVASILVVSTARTLSASTCGDNGGDVTNQSCCDQTSTSAVLSTQAKEGGGGTTFTRSLPAGDPAADEGALFTLRSSRTPRGERQWQFDYGLGLSGSTLREVKSGERTPAAAPPNEWFAVPSARPREAESRGGLRLFNWSF